MRVLWHCFFLGCSPWWVIGVCNAFGIGWNPCHRSDREESDPVFSNNDLFEIGQFTFTKFTGALFWVLCSETFLPPKCIALIWILRKLTTVQRTVSTEMKRSQSLDYIIELRGAAQNVSGGISRVVVVVNETFQGWCWPVCEVLQERGIFQ